MLRIVFMSAVAAAALNLSGCASIVNGQNQSLSATTRKDGVDLAGAKCSLLNDKGTWYVTTPGSVTVHRSFQDMTVNCAVDSQDPGIATVKSATKGMAFGNILLGGVIGEGVDVATGAAYDYPEVIVVTMGGKAAPPTVAATATTVAPSTPPSPTLPAPTTTPDTTVSAASPAASSAAK